MIGSRQNEWCRLEDRHPKEQSQKRGLLPASHFAAQSDPAVIEIVGDEEQSLP